LCLSTQTTLQPFLQLAAAASGGATHAVFQQYWSSLPWARAAFHAASPQALAELRAFLPSPDGAAAELLRALDWGAPLARARPPPAARPAAVYSLGEEEEAGGLLLDGSSDAYGRGLWAAELSLLLLHAGALLPADALPPWALEQLGGGGEAGPQAPPPPPGLPAMLGVADWTHISDVITAPGLPAPWLLLPLLLAPSMARGDAAARVTHAARLLSRGAAAAGSALAAAAAAGAVRPLLGISLCHGFLAAAAVARAAPGAAAAPRALAHEALHIPDDIPRELLEGTVELQQLQLQDEERRLAEEEAAEAAAAAAAAGPPGARSLPVVEVVGCFRLTAAQHAELAEHALLPLAAQHASLQLASTLAADQCPPFAEQPLDADPSAPSSAYGGSLLSTWRPPPLASLVSHVALPVRRATKRPDRSAEDQAAAVSALLRALVEQPVTVLVGEPLPFANAEVPWNNTAAVFFNPAGRQPAAPAARDGMRALRRRLAALLRGGGGRPAGADDAVAADPAAALNQAVACAAALQNLLAALIEVGCHPPAAGPLAACLLRVVCASEAAQGMALATHLAENLLRHLATPAPPSARAGMFASGGLASHAVLHRAGAPAEEPPAAVVPVVAADAAAAAPTVTQLDAGPAGAGGVAGAVVVPPSMRFATAAAAGLEPAALLGLARRAVALRRPLLAAFALERLRQETLPLDKGTWQSVVVRVLGAARAAEANAEQPLEAVAVWLEALPWINDSRWRRLPPGARAAAACVLCSCATPVRPRAPCFPAHFG
jgi:hypothetical protein